MQSTWMLDISTPSVCSATDYCYFFELSKFSSTYIWIPRPVVLFTGREEFRSHAALLEANDCKVQ